MDTATTPRAVETKGSGWAVRAQKLRGKARRRKHEQADSRNVGEKTKPGNNCGCQNADDKNRKYQVRFRSTTLPIFLQRLLLAEANMKDSWKSLSLACSSITKIIEGWVWSLLECDFKKKKSVLRRRKKNYKLKYRQICSHDSQGNQTLKTLSAYKH